MPLYTRIRKRLTDEQIVALYEQVRSSDAVSVDAGVCPATVLKIIRAMGREDLIAKRGKGTRGHYRKIKIPDAEIVRRYTEGKESAYTIGADIGTPPRSIYTVLERNGIPRRSAKATLQEFHWKRRKEKERERRASAALVAGDPPCRT